MLKRACVTLCFNDILDLLRNLNVAKARPIMVTVSRLGYIPLLLGLSVQGVYVYINVVASPRLLKSFNWKLGEA